MRAISSFKDLEFVIKHKLTVHEVQPYRTEKGNSRDIPFDEFMSAKRSLKGLMQMFAEKQHVYNEDLDGSQTVIHRKFNSYQEAVEFLAGCDTRELQAELKEIYGPHSAHIDDEFQLVITKIPQK